MIITYQTFWKEKTKRLPIETNYLAGFANNIGI